MIVGNDTVTIYNYIDEDDAGRANWKRTVITGVDVFRYDGIQQYVGRELEGKDHIALYIHAAMSVSDNEYIQPNKFNIEDNEGYYTLNVNGRDRIMLDESFSEKPLEGYGTYRIISVQDNRSAKSDYLKHIKVIGA